MSRIALSLCNLGMMALLDGDIHRAASLFAEGAEIATEIGDKRQVRAALGGLGWVAYLEQRCEEADSFARESLLITRELGMKRGFVDPMFCLAGSSAGAGNLERAARLAAAADHYDSLVGNDDIGDEARYQAVIESAKTACDPETWERAWAEGRAMSLDEAVEYALSSA